MDNKFELETVTFALPGCAIRVADTAAFKRFPLTNVVARGLPFQSTTAPETNPLPFTARVKAAPPAVVMDGLRELIAGPAVIVSVATLDLTPF